MRRAFTLIELLVVVAIVAILAAILFPVFSQAKAAAQSSRCLSQLRQIGTSLQLYVADHDDTYPVAFFWSEHDGLPCIMTSFQTMQPYQRSALILVCPTDRAVLDYVAGTQVMRFPAPCPSSPDVRRMSYQPNLRLVDVGDPNFLVNPHTGQTGRPVRRASEVEFPADTAAFSDATIALQGGTANYTTYDLPVQPRHRDLAHAVWADGHAQPVRTRPELDADGTQLGGLQLDLQPIASWLVSGGGPYSGGRQLVGIPYRAADGSWALR
ncbi:MAG: type II secretion system GspH family protein [Fimbriimonadales bacterium]|nr:type II secretion system GspH family protein [Fimbriimonadales bacterium]